MRKLLFAAVLLFSCSAWTSARTDVTNLYLQNAGLTSLSGWDYGNNGYDYTDWKKDGSVPVVEFYHTWSANPGTAIGETRNFHLTQTATLPAGDYRLVINAFYREGKGDGTSKAVIIAGTQEKAIRGYNEGEINNFSGSNALYKSANAFSQGYFPNYIDFTVDAQQEVTVGISGYIDTYDSWCILGPAKLFQYEAGEAKTEEDNPVIPTKYVAPDWSDYPISFSHSWTDDTSRFTSPNITSGETSMTATMTVDQDATLVFEYNGNSGSWVSNYGNLNIYLDNQLVETVNTTEWNSGTKRYFVEMNAGEHTVKWTYVRDNTTSRSATIQNIGIIASPTITVNLLEPGSLGTEVLNQIDHIRKARKLVINGPMNDDDWAKIKMMPNLLSIDLSGTDITKITSGFFQESNFPFLHHARLPETLITIESSAFVDSNIDDINFPSSLKGIGGNAFARSKIREAMLPNTMTSVEPGVFRYCHFLRKANFPENIKVIQSDTFQECNQLYDLTLHEGLTEIQLWGIRNVPYSKRLPSTITTRGEGACADNWVIGDTLYIPESCTSMGLAAFQNCSNVKVVVLPVGYYQCSTGNDVFNFWSIQTLIIKSPSVLSGSKITTIVPYGRREAITLKVPDYLVSSYKLDSYWYEFGNIEGFSTAEVKDWTINQPLVLNNSRFEGKPNIYLHSNGSLKLNGEAPMTINDLFFTRDWNSPTGWNTQILSNCENITIDGTVSMTHFCRPKTWSFVCLPFDARVSDISNLHGAKYAIRYYDGANRAANGTGGNWKNFTDDDVIPAGTGFILQPSDYSSMRFLAIDNEQKQLVMSNREFTKPLAANNSAITANKGWNLVGNPWHCYYNIHKLNFTAPITTWNGSTYVAYSIIDDDYAIKPNEAFFVQCPDEVTEISFPTDGRQLTSVIESQNASRKFGEEQNIRQIAEIEISIDNLSDKTRVDLNEKASISYEPNAHASKLFTMDSEVPQIYTIDTDGNEYAINERPLSDGNVKLRLNVQKTGSYTISSPRSDMKRIVLKVLLTDMTTILCEDTYTIELGAGIYAERFELNFADNAVTEIVSMKQQQAGYKRYYNLKGQQIANPTKGVYIVKGKKVVVK